MFFLRMALKMETVSVISLTKVEKTYRMGDEVVVSALSGVTLTITSGEFVAIVGPSGSGKSTLMHIIGLLDLPTSGKVSLLGKDVSQLDEKALASLRNVHIGFIFQSFNLLPRTTCVDNVELPLIYAGDKRVERMKKAITALETVNLGDRLYHFPSQLSGGQQQRVAIARALITSPDLILADEPTGNLDSTTGRKIMETLINLHEKEQKTVIVVTHDPTIADYSEQIINIKDGMLVSNHLTTEKVLWERKK